MTWTFVTRLWTALVAIGLVIPGPAAACGPSTPKFEAATLQSDVNDQMQRLLLSDATGAVGMPWDSPLMSWSSKFGDWTPIMAGCRYVALLLPVNNFEIFGYTHDNLVRISGLNRALPNGFNDDFFVRITALRRINSRMQTVKNSAVRARQIDIFQDFEIALQYIFLGPLDPPVFKAYYVEIDRNARAIFACTSGSPDKSAVARHVCQLRMLLDDAFIIDYDVPPDVVMSQERMAVVLERLTRELRRKFN
jgi:hypothetical protein